MDLLRIDGAHGEGGGQIVRSAIALSCITKRPVRLENIRKNRKGQGLKPQHVAAVRILQKIAGAQVTGAEIGSTELRFVPGDVSSLDLVEDVGTAGSISLVLQVLIPVVALTQNRLDLTIRGGTDVLWSPSFDYTQHVLREAYSRMGIQFSLELRRRGYYPRGAGEINLRVSPSSLRPVSLSRRETNHAKIACTASKIPLQKIREQVGEIGRRLAEKGFSVESKITNQEAADSGASLLVYSADGQSVMGADCQFDKKMQKFDIDIDRFADNTLGVDENLADMLVVPASLAAGRTAFRVRRITGHLETNLFVTSKITGCRYGIGRLDGGFEVIIEGISHPRVK